MSQLPDFTDPRYLDEVGWFLHHEKFGRRPAGVTYEDERIKYSGMLLDEFLSLSGKERAWIADKCVATIGCGCTGDLAVWPVAVKVAIDPLLAAYQKLDMLIADRPGTPPTLYLPLGAEDLPLLDCSIDLVVCRNALDHMPDPDRALREFARVLRPEGLLFLSVDIGGEPTPDEPSPFSQEDLAAQLVKYFGILNESRSPKPHSADRTYSVRVIAGRKDVATEALDKDALLESYLKRVDDLRNHSG